MIKEPQIYHGRDPRKNPKVANFRAVRPFHEGQASATISSKSDASQKQKFLLPLINRWDLIKVKVPTHAPPHPSIHLSLPDVESTNSSTPLSMSSPTKDEVFDVAREAISAFASRGLYCVLVGGVACSMFGNSRSPNVRLRYSQRLTGFTIV